MKQHFKLEFTDNGYIITCDDNVVRKLGNVEREVAEDEYNKMLEWLNVR